MNLKEMSEELASYIADAEKLEMVSDLFKDIEGESSTDHRNDVIEVPLHMFKKLKALIED